MKYCDRLRDIEDGALLLDPDGKWPSFHDADVYTVNFWSGDLRPDENVWIGPQIGASFGILGPKGEIPFAILKIKFKDCDCIEMTGTGLGCPQIYDLEFGFEERAYLNDGKTPLSPYIHVRFSLGPETKPLLSFRCFSVQGISREEPQGPPYA